MKNMRIKIAPFTVYADEDDRESIVFEILSKLEEISDEPFFTSTVIEDEEDSEDAEDESF